QFQEVDDGHGPAERQHRPADAAAAAAALLPVRQAQARNDRAHPRGGAGHPGLPVKSRRASILVIVLITLVLTAAALVAFLDRAANDLLMAARSAQADRLRPDAYSALEVVLGVLEDFRESDNGLRHPSEGWGDPLTWAGWTPADGYTVEVAIQDESGKMPLRTVTATEMLNLFQYWGMSPPDAQRMTDSLLSWMRQ